MIVRKAAPISAVIPAFNREKYIRAAIESIRRQTLPVAEIVVVDDGSTDGTALLAASLGARVLRQPNRGVSAARNAGVHATSQPFVAFLDSDDLWDERKIQLQWRAMELCPEAEFVFTDMVQFDADSVVVESFLADRPNFKKVRRTAVAEGISCCDRESLAEHYLSENFISTCTLLASRRVLLRTGLFDESFGHCEDRDLCLRLLAIATGAVVERPLVRNRLHGHGASRDGLMMALGAATVARRVLANPDRYPPGASAYYRSVQPQSLRVAGLRSMEAGDFQLARRLLWDSFRHRRAPGTFAATLIALGGPRVYRGLRWVKRRWGLPGLRSNWFEP